MAGIDYSRRHLRFGWWSVCVFAAFGLLLESFHGFKLRGYLDVSNETRRLMWTLAHAHGTLLGLVHIAYALTLRAIPDLPVRHPNLVSRGLFGASVLLPGGFFLGGVAFYAGDPGLGVLLVPVGAILLLTSAGLVARAAGTTPGKGPEKSASRSQK